MRNGKRSCLVVARYQKAAKLSGFLIGPTKCAKSLATSLDSGLKLGQIVWRNFWPSGPRAGTRLHTLQNDELKTVFRTKQYFYYLTKGFLAPCTSKWRWQPVERPVLPIRAICWPLCTVSPETTSSLPAWA